VAPSIASLRLAKIASSVFARSRDGLVERLRSRPGLAERVVVLPRLVPSRSARARLYRTFSWPLIDHLRPQLEISSVGGKLVVDTGDVVGRVLTASGVWEPHVTEAFRARLGAGAVCVDVGAHVGYYTLLAAKLVGPGGKVYAFEPSPRVYRALEQNLARNDVTNVTALNVAAGAGCSTGTLYELAEGSSGNSSLSPRLLDSPHGGTADEYVSVEVEICAADSRVPPEELTRVRMIKIDVEGYEVEALRGVERILAAGSPIAVIVELSPDWSLDPPAPFVEDLCRRHGLTPYRLVNEYSLDGYFPARIQAPVPIAAIPTGRCDLLLARSSTEPAAK